MRNISFALTKRQFIARTKTVTRRLGWWDLVPGDRLMGVEKAMGLKPGEKIVRLGLIEVVSARPEPLESITPEDVVLEGFPEMTPEQFVDQCLDLVGPLAVSDETRATLIAFAARDGDLHLQERQPGDTSEQRVGNLLRMIASTREFQLA